MDFLKKCREHVLVTDIDSSRKIMKKVYLLLIGVGVICVLGFGTRHFLYPFGDRPCTFACLSTGVHGYALDHGGWFPISDKGAYEALRLLYPTNCTAAELAGVSGNRSAVAHALRTGKPFSAEITSLVYFPGFRVDDEPTIAIIWERTPGLYPSGRRNFNGSRAVLLVTGTVTNVPGNQWEDFEKRQEQLRSAVQASRASQPNAVGQP